jgi:hypothetical protein
MKAVARIPVCSSFLWNRRAMVMMEEEKSGKVFLAFEGEEGKSICGHIQNKTTFMQQFAKGDGMLCDQCANHAMVKERYQLIGTKEFDSISEDNIKNDILPMMEPLDIWAFMKVNKRLRTLVLDYFRNTVDKRENADSRDIKTSKKTWQLWDIFYFVFSKSNKGSYDLKRIFVKPFKDRERAEGVKFLISMKHMDDLWDLWSILLDNMAQTGSFKDNLGHFYQYGFRSYREEVFEVLYDNLWRVLDMIEQPVVRRLVFEKGKPRLFTKLLRLKRFHGRVLANIHKIGFASELADLKGDKPAAKNPIAEILLGIYGTKLCFPYEYDRDIDKQCSNLESYPIDWKIEHLPIFIEAIQLIKDNVDPILLQKAVEWVEKSNRNYDWLDKVDWYQLFQYAYIQLISRNSIVHEHPFVYNEYPILGKELTLRLRDFIEQNKEHNRLKLRYSSFEKNVEYLPDMIFAKKAFKKLPWLKDEFFGNVDLDFFRKELQEILNFNPMEMPDIVINVDDFFAVKKRKLNEEGEEESSEEEKDTSEEEGFNDDMDNE